MKSGTMKSRVVSRVLTVLLAVALFISMMPLGLGSVFAADPADYQPVLTITKPDGSVVSYQTVNEAVEAFSGSITDDTSFGLTLEGIPVKRLLKDYDDNCVVTVQTTDNYTGTLNANGKTVAELKAYKGLLAFKAGDTPYDPTVDGTKDKGYFKFYVGKDADGKVMVDKWVNRITISNSSSDSQDPEPEPDILTVTGEGLKSTLSYDTIKTLKNDTAIIPLILTGVQFHTVNKEGTQEDFTVAGVTIESLISLAGLKDGVELESVTATAEDGYSKTYTAEEITSKDLQGNKAMFIWDENGNKVTKTAIGQFKDTDINRPKWISCNKSMTLTVNTKVTSQEDTSTTPPPTTAAETTAKGPVVTVKAGKKKATVTWKKVKGAKGYEIFRSTKKSKGFKKIKTIKSGKTLKFVNKKLKGGKVYYYKVRAYKKNAKGKKVYGKFSEIKSIKTRK